MTIKLEHQDGIAVVTMSQPQKHNAVSPEMWDQLAEIFPRLDDDPEVRCIVLRGEGRAFCSGSDLGKIDSGGPISDGTVRLKRANRMILAIHNCDTPVIAAVKGVAIGVGWSLALACDMIVACEDAKFIAGFMKIGLVPDGGAIWFLARRIGLEQAKKITYLAQTIPASEALRIGLVSDLVAVDEFEEFVATRARALAAQPTYALGLTKRMFRVVEGPGLATFLEQEEMAQLLAKQSPDVAEGIAAFKAKRKPEFTGR